MNAERQLELMISKTASAIGEPARVRMLYCLLDGRSRTSTELAVIAGVSPSTASVHLQRLVGQRLMTLSKQGKHRYYSLAGTDVAVALEAIDVVAGRSRDHFIPSTPAGLLAARTCYDHIAGRAGVSLRNRFQVLGWISANIREKKQSYNLTAEGTKALKSLGVDFEAAAAMRRRFAYPCMDWSERQPHIAGALGALLLKLALRRKWFVQELDSRALTLTRLGLREMQLCFGLEIQA